MACHEQALEKEKDLPTVVLISNPNVGKSTLFNRYTGLKVMTGNYPGLTTTLSMGEVEVKNSKKSYYMLDIPGIYSLNTYGEDEKVALRAFIHERPDLIVNLVDARNLERNLFLTFQLLDLGIPMIIALNQIDIIKAQGITLDPSKLEKLLNVPVVPISAFTGENLDDLNDKIEEFLFTGKQPIERSVSYSVEMEVSIEDLEKNLIEEIDKFNLTIDHSEEIHHKPFKHGRRGRRRRSKNDEGFRGRFDRGKRGSRRGRGRIKEWGINTSPFEFFLPPRTIAIRLLYGDEEINNLLPLQVVTNLEPVIERNNRRIEDYYHVPLRMRLSNELYSLSSTISESVVEKHEKKLLLREKIDTVFVYPLTGIPLLILSLFGIMFAIFSLGDFLATNFALFWETTVSPPLQDTINLIPNSLVRVILIWSLDYGLEASIEVGVPYVIVFYIVLALLEDTGILARMAYHSDVILKRMGLHGQSLIPMIVGFGCSVPAILGTRSLKSRKQRLTTSVLILLIPCGARIAVILGGLAHYAGYKYTLLLYGVNILVIIAVGLLLAKTLPGKDIPFIYEIPMLARPKVSTVLWKTWFRFKEFLYQAIPIIIAGSALLGVLIEYDILDKLVDPLAFFTVGVLGLPKVVIIVLLFGFLRKEATLAMLVALLSPVATNPNLMTPEQWFVFTIVVLFYIPCLATLSVMAKEFSKKETALMVVGTLGLAIFAGALANFLFIVF
ncbi:MAG: ferrous iron transporter B [Candidatus Kariarchaeaceae archaeon]